MQRETQGSPVTAGERTGQLDRDCERMALLAAAAASHDADLAAMFLRMADALDLPGPAGPPLRLIASHGRLLAEAAGDQQPA